MENNQSLVVKHDLNGQTKNLFGDYANCICDYKQEDDVLYFLPFGFYVSPNGEWREVRIKDLPESMKEDIRKQLDEPQKQYDENDLINDTF